MPRSHPLKNLWQPDGKQADGAFLHAPATRAPLEIPIAALQDSRCRNRLGLALTHRQQSLGVSIRQPKRLRKPFEPFPVTQRTTLRRADGGLAAAVAPQEYDPAQVSCTRPRWRWLGQKNDESRVWRRTSTFDFPWYELSIADALGHQQRLSRACGVTMPMSDDDHCPYQGTRSLRCNRRTYSSSLRHCSDQVECQAGLGRCLEATAPMAVLGWDVVCPLSRF